MTMQVEKMRDQCSEEATVVVTCGANHCCFALAGLAVGTVKRRLRHILNIPYFAAAFVNGTNVCINRVLAKRDRLDFRQIVGFKGAEAELPRSIEVSSLLRSYPELLAIGQSVKALRLDAEHTVDLLLKAVGSFIEERFGQLPKKEMLTIREVATLLACSYGEARERMLDGRIRAVKDGRWCRSRIEWVEGYIEKQTIKPVCSRSEMLRPGPVRRSVAGIKTDGVAGKFLQNRKN